MPSIINLGSNKYITVDRMWRDNGADAQYALLGGQKILIQSGTRPKPTICQRGSEFFYYDGRKVDLVADIDWLPEPFRSTAIKFIESQETTSKKKDKVPVVEVFETKEKAAAALEAKKGRGRPKKEEPKPKRIEIKDEKSYLAAGGIPA